MPTSRAEGQSGFTLLELLAVLVILALAATAVLQLGRGSAETARVRAFPMQAEAMMRQARNQALETMVAKDVIVDAAGRRLVFADGGKSLAVPDGVTLEGQVAQLPGATEGAFIVRFYPEGGSTGTSLPFRYRGIVYELRVNWLTGHADVRKG